MTARQSCVLKKGQQRKKISTRRSSWGWTTPWGLYNSVCLTLRSVIPCKHLLTRTPLPIADLYVHPISFSDKFCSHCLLTKHTASALTRALRSNRHSTKAQATLNTGRASSSSEWSMRSGMDARTGRAFTSTITLYKIVRCTLALSFPKAKLKRYGSYMKGRRR